MKGAFPRNGRIALRRSEWFALAVATAAGAVALVYGFRKIPELQLAGVVLWMVLALIMMAGVVLATAPEQRPWWRPLILVGIGAGGFVLSFVMQSTGAIYRDHEFRRTLSAYGSVVERVRSGALPPGLLPPDSLPSEIRTCCYQVVAGWDSAGHLAVEFLEDRGFPMKQSGWLYYSGESARQIARSRGWYNGYEVAPHWYRVSN
jgi:hypothetical protein